MTPSPGVTALDRALETLAHVMSLTPRQDLADAIERVRHARAVLVQTETDLKECNKSSLAAHQRVNALEAGAEELFLRESVALECHAQRVIRLNALCRVPSEEIQSFVVSTDTPRPTAAPTSPT